MCLNSTTISLSEPMLNKILHKEILLILQTLSPDTHWFATFFLHPQNYLQQLIVADNPSSFIANN